MTPEEDYILKTLGLENTSVKMPEVIIHPVTLSRILFDTRMRILRGETKEAMAILEVLDNLLLYGRAS